MFGPRPKPQFSSMSEVLNVRLLCSLPRPILQINKLQYIDFVLVHVLSKLIVHKPSTCMHGS